MSDNNNNIAYIIGKVDLLAGNYYGVYSGHEVKVYSNGWMSLKALTGIRSTVNCLVKVNDDGSAIVVF